MASDESAKWIPVLDVDGAVIRRINLKGTILRGANLSGADGSGASFQDADFQDARLDGTILRGAHCPGAKNLTLQPLASAIIDERTRLPTSIDRQQLLNEVLRQTEGANS